MNTHPGNTFRASVLIAVPRRLAAGIMVIFMSAIACSGSDDGRSGFPDLELSSTELARLMTAPEGERPILLDVRTPGEFRAGAIPGAVNIPVDTIATNPPSKDPSAKIVVYCRSGMRSRAAKRALEQLGYSNVNDFGGINRWNGDLSYPGE